MEIVTLREFARRVGVSLPAVRKGIASGRIAAIADPETGKYTGIDYDTQGPAWTANSKAPQRRPHTVAGGRPRIDGKPVAAPKTGQKKPAEEAPPKGGMSLADTQRARELVKLQLDNLKLKEAQGELIRVDQVKNDMAKLAATVKSSLLNIPDRIAAELAGMNDPHEIHTLITNELMTAMKELCSRGGVE